MRKNNLFTGERIVPNNSTPKILIGSHKERYIYFKKYVKNKKVLDLACGIGYGSKILKEGGALSVLGGDISEMAIQEANRNYKIKGVKFTKMNAEKIGLRQNSMDIIVSFETIEHLKNYKSFLEGVYKTLKKDGIFILSTPNKNITSPFSKTPFNKFHIKEFTLNEILREILDSGFKIESIMGQCKIKTDLLFYIKEIIKTYFPFLFKIAIKKIPLRKHGDYKIEPFNFCSRRYGFSCIILILRKF